MAVLPNIVDNHVDQELINRIEKEIDSKLNDPNHVRDNRRGPPEDPYWTIVVQGHLNHMEKGVLAGKYTKAGWPHVMVKNSDENGERPGLVGITLHRNPQPNNL